MHSGAPFHAPVTIIWVLPTLGHCEQSWCILCVQFCLNICLHCSWPGAWRGWLSDVVGPVPSGKLPGDFPQLPSDASPQAAEWDPVNFTKCIKNLFSTITKTKGYKSSCIYKTRRYCFTCRQVPDQTRRRDREVGMGRGERCVQRRRERGKGVFSQHKSTGRSRSAQAWECWRPCWHWLWWCRQEAEPRMSTCSASDAWLFGYQLRESLG